MNLLVLGHLGLKAGPWKSGFAWSCSHGRLLISPRRSVKEGHNFTTGAKRCSQNSAPQGSYSRFTMAVLRSKPGHKELIKVRLVRFDMVKPIHPSSAQLDPSEFLELSGKATVKPDTVYLKLKNPSKPLSKIVTQGAAQEGERSRSYSLGCMVKIGQATKLSALLAAANQSVSRVRAKGWI